MNVTVALSEHFGHCLLGSNRPDEFIRHNTISEVINDQRTVSFTVLEEKTNKSFSFEVNDKNIIMYDQNNNRLSQFKKNNIEKAVESAVKKVINKTYVKLKLDYYTYNEDKISPGVIVFPKFR